MAIDFVGTDEYVNCSSGTSLANLGAVTGCAWMRLDTVPTSGLAFTVLDKASSGAGTAGWIFSVLGLGAGGGQTGLRLITIWDTTNGNWRAVPAFSSGAWYHIAFSHANMGSSTVDPILYVNGSLVTSSETVAPTGVHPADSSVALGIGSRVSVPQAYFDGQMEDVRVFNRALSAQEIANLAAGYRGPLGDEVGWWRMDEVDGATLSSATAVVFDISGNGNHGTPQGGCLGAASYAPRMSGWIPQ